MQGQRASHAGVGTARACSHQPRAARGPATAVAAASNARLAAPAATQTAAPQATAAKKLAALQPATAAIAVRRQPIAVPRQPHAVLAQLLEVLQGPSWAGPQGSRPRPPPMALPLAERARAPAWPGLTARAPDSIRSPAPSATRRGRRSAHSIAAPAPPRRLPPCQPERRMPPHRRGTVMGGSGVARPTAMHPRTSPADGRRQRQRGLHLGTRPMTPGSPDSCAGAARLTCDAAHSMYAATR